MLPGVTIFDGVPENDGDVVPALPAPIPDDGPGLVLDGVSVDDPTGGGGGQPGGGTINPPNPGPPNPTPLPKTVLELFCAPCAASNSGVHKFFDQTSVASGGVQPYFYDISGGTLPDGTELLTENGTLNNSARVYGQATTVGPYSYKVRVTDSTGILSFAPIGNGTHGSGLATYSNDGPGSVHTGALNTPDDNQLIMLICITARDVSGSPVFNEVTDITSSSLSFTRIFHDTFTYTDSAADAALPVACISIDIFTAPAPTQITTGITWQGHLSISSDFSNHISGTIAALSIGGLKDINNPFDPLLDFSSPGPNVAVNTSGSASAPTNTHIDTSIASATLFALTINHDTFPNATGVAPSGWILLGDSNTSTPASGINMMLSYQTQTAILTGAEAVAWFSDNFWYQLVVAFNGKGCLPLTAEQTVSGTITGVVPGMEIITLNSSPELVASDGEGLFQVPVYNNLRIEVFGGSLTGTQLNSTFGADLSVGVNGHAVYNFTPATPGAPIDDGSGVMPYTIGTGSPAGEIIFTWS